MKQIKRKPLMRCMAPCCKPVSTHKRAVPVTYKQPLFCYRRP